MAPGLWFDQNWIIGIFPFSLFLSHPLSVLAVHSLQPQRRQRPLELSWNWIEMELFRIFKDHRYCLMVFVSFLVSFFLCPPPVKEVCDFEGGVACGWERVCPAPSALLHSFRWLPDQGNTVHLGEQYHRPVIDHTLWVTNTCTDTGTHVHVQYRHTYVHTHTH